MALKKTTELKKHQVVGVNFMLKHNYVLNADEMGLGKTLQAIAVQQSDDLNCVVVCPNTIKFNWQQEFFKFTDYDKSMVKIGLTPAKVNIVNYEKLSKVDKLISKAQIVIFDEAHYLKNLDSKRTKYAHDLIKKYKPERLILLTGTPVKERIADFYSPLCLLSYTPVKNNGRSIVDAFPSKTKFSNRFCFVDRFDIPVRMTNGREFKKTITKYYGVKNENELRAFLVNKYMRRTTNHVIDLPKLIHKDVFLSFVSQDEGVNVEKKVESAIRSSEATAEYAWDVFQDITSPVIIFSDFIKPLENIKSRLISKKLKVELVTGDTSMEERARSLNLFQSGKLPVLLLTYGVGSTGLNLTASNQMILNDPSWELSTMEQAFKRFHRIGQNKTCIVHRIISSDVSSQIYNMIDEKRFDINKIITSNKGK